MKKIISTILAIAMILTMVNIPVVIADENQVSVASETNEVTLISVEEDLTQYSSVEDVPYFVYEDGDHATVSVEKGKGIVVKHIKSTPVLDGGVNTNQAAKIAHVVEGKFNEDVEKRTSYRIDRYAGKYKITIDFESSNEKYTEQVDGVTITSPYYLFTMGGIPTPESLTTSVSAKYTSRIYTTSAGLYSASASATVKFNEGEPHQMVMEVDTTTKDVSLNIDNYKTPAVGVMKSDGYINGFSLSGMERMKDNSFFIIKKIKIEQTEADVATTTALSALGAIADPAADPYAVTKDITLSEYDNITWSSSDESVIDATGKVTRGAEDKDVTITATYKNGNIILYKDYVLTVKAYTEKEIATADVESINLELGEAVTEDITLPQVGDRGTALSWASSHPDVIDSNGKVTRAENDTTVTLTVTGVYGSSGTHSKTFTAFVPKKDDEAEPEPEPQPPVQSDLIYIEEDFTKYSSVDEIPYLEISRTTHATVEAVEGKGLLVTQTISTPVVDDAVNAEQVPRIAHVFEGKFNEDSDNRTAYKIGRFAGKYRIDLDYEVDIPAYTEEVDGVTISTPYYTLTFGSVPIPSSLTSSITNSVFMRVKQTSMAALGAVSSQAFTPGSVKYTAGEPHKMTMEFDTLTRETTVNVDNYKKPMEGYLGKPGYINAFYIAGMERMKVGSYILIKKISVQQLEENEDTTEALETLSKLPDSLVADPYAVTGDITLPDVDSNITWSTSDSLIITDTGKVNRWYADRDVVITATYTSYDTIVSKEYTLTVKELDSYDTTEVLSKYGKELSFVDEMGDLSKGDTTVDEKGITVTKTVDGENADDSEMPVYYADYRLYSDKIPYSDDTKTSLATAGYSGVYDISLKVTPSVAGTKPVYVSLGNKDENFSEVAGIAVTKDGISVVHEKKIYKFIKEATTGNTYDVTFRVDTDQKRVWIYVDGALAGDYYEFSKTDVIDVLRVTLDENNMSGDSIAVDGVTVTEISGNTIADKDKMANILDKVTMDDVTSNPENAENINDLPESIQGYEVEWSSNNILVNVETGNVYHGEADETVIVSAVISVDGVSAKKDFYINVAKAETGEEKLDYYLNNIEDVITNQDADDIRYDINLPESYNGVSITWSSSKPEILDADGKVAKDIAITEPTKVVLTASVVVDGSVCTRSYTYTVSPRAFERVVYEGNGAPESITINGFENIAVTCTSVVNIKFKQNGNGKITLTDSDARNIIIVNISDNMYNITYGGETTVNYPVASGSVAELDVIIMPDKDKVAVLADGVLVVDNEDTVNEISDISSVEVTGGAEVTETKIITDEYGVLDINAANAGYFDVFAKNVVKENVEFVRETVIPADVEWKSSDDSLLNDENGNVTVPGTYKFVDVTLTLTSEVDSNVKRVITKRIAVACPVVNNLAGGVKAVTNAAAKPKYDIAYVTDGNFDTAFGTSYAKRSPEITLDFGKETYFNTVYVNEDFTEYDSSLKSYTVAYSNDNESWTVIKSGTITDVDSALISFDTVYARYLKFTAVECEETNLHINEIEVYLYASDAELVKLDVEQIKLDTGYTVTGDIELPKTGQFGTTFTWESSEPQIIDENGKYTQPDTDTNVILTVTGKNGDETYTKAFGMYVSGKKSSGSKPVGGGSSGGGGGSSAGAGLGTSQVPGFIETDRTEEIVDEPDVTESVFADMDETHWAYENVKKLKELGVVNGDDNGNFNPSGKVTREQFLKMLVIATNVELHSSATAFDDVDENAWYAQYVAAGVSAGLINGITPNIFGVGAEISRQDMAVMIMRILDKNNIPVTQTSEMFDDNDVISDYAEEAVYKVRDAKIIEGYNNKFNPKDSLTRAEAATVIIKLLEVLK